MPTESHSTIDSPPPLPALPPVSMPYKIDSSSAKLQDRKERTWKETKLKTNESNKGSQYWTQFPGLDTCFRFGSFNSDNGFLSFYSLYANSGRDLNGKCGLIGMRTRMTLKLHYCVILKNGGMGWDKIRCPWSTSI